MQIKPPAQLPDHAREVLIAARSSRRRRRWPWALGGLAIALAAALAFALLAWPRGALRLDATGLPQVQLPRLAGNLVRVSLRSEDGTSIPVIVRRDGTVWPTRRVIPGTRLFAEAVFRRPVWNGWITGRTQTAAAGTGGAQGAPLGPLAAGGGRSAAAGEVRSARARGRVDGYSPGADGAPAASNSHRRARPARRCRLGRRQRRPAGVGAASASDDRHLVPPRQGDDAAHLAGARLPARSDRAASTSVLGAGRARAAPAAALARPRRPPAIGGGPTRTRSSSCPGATASVSTGACS